VLFFDFFFAKKNQKTAHLSLYFSYRGCLISHSAAPAAVVNFKEAYVFEKLRSNFSKTYASKEFYLPLLTAA
jgi:hypothetical protein